MGPPLPLTVRNITPTPIEIKLLERYEAPGGGQKSEESAQNYAREDVSVRIDPFKSASVDFTATECCSAQDILRVTIEAEGQKYRIDNLSAQNESPTFTALCHDAKNQYTAVFIPDCSHLAIFTSANLECWMKEIADETPLSAISIPGTHNSTTCYRALPSVRCQAVSPRQQLDHGVRFLDIRVQPEAPHDAKRDGLIVVHGAFPVSMTGTKYFRSFERDVADFLQRNPTETVIVSLKREGGGAATDQQLSLILRNHYTNNARLWWTEPRIPRLGEARGRIVLFRRFLLDDAVRRAEHAGRGFGINADVWSDNYALFTHNDVCVQDFYDLNEDRNIEYKISVVAEHLERTGRAVCPVGRGIPGAAPNRLHVNFLSASSFFTTKWWPENIAAKLNAAIVRYLCRTDLCGSDAQLGDGCAGVVVCDWVGNKGDWGIVRCIVGMNARLAMREKRAEPQAQAHGGASPISGDLMDGSKT